MTAATTTAVRVPVDVLTARRRGLDPRTKIVLLVLVSGLVMAPGGLRFVLPGILLAVGLAVWDRAWRRLATLLVMVGAMWLIGWGLPLLWPNIVTATLSLLGVYGIRFVTAIGVGRHVVATTSPTQLSAGLRAWHVPRAIAVTLAVMLRFFPVVAIEARAVLDAMRLRGLTGIGGFLRHPLRSIERFTVPMIAASLRAGEDLSASAILRGLGSHRVPTAMIPPRFGIADLLLVLAVAALAAASLLLPSPLG